MQDASIIFNYFRTLSSCQKEQFLKLESCYQRWNERINIISRKDIMHLYERHVLHALGIAKVISFKEGAHVLDVGSGGGFPGIPLAIYFPHVQFHLVDSIEKKTHVIREVVRVLGLHNVRVERCRVEDVHTHYDFVVGRAVARMNLFYTWIQKNIKTVSVHDMDNGILCLKGGDLDKEMNALGKPYSLYALSDYFREVFFETKYVAYVPLV